MNYHIVFCRPWFVQFKTDLSSFEIPARARAAASVFQEEQVNRQFLLRILAANAKNLGETKFKKIRQGISFMHKRHVASGSIVLMLAACSESPSISDGSATYPPISEQVALLAAPSQDLSTARLRSEDNCYWYMHAGPVETTLLPLRTVEGNPICVKRAE
jgi:hypothetical protein